MRTLTTDEIEAALVRLERGLNQYLWLQSHVHSCDVTADEDFQKRFNGFYRVRRGSQWRSIYFGLMESSKLRGIEFPDALKEINRCTNRVEASFASKLIATLDPSKPVIDKFVLKHFELRLPRNGSADRELKTIQLYRELCDKYKALLESPTGSMIRRLFDNQYPGLEVSELKKLDLVFWQVRE